MEETQVHYTALFQSRTLNTSNISLNSFLENIVETFNLSYELAALWDGKTVSDCFEMFKVSSNLSEKLIPSNDRITTKFLVSFL